MAVLKIHSDIVDEETRMVNMSWFGIDGTSFDSVDDFVESIDKEDKEIELRINCRGGDCMEGWSIYDKLRSTGKEITAIIEGKCASMASVILLAASKEKRFGYQNASLLIHNPYIPPYTLADAYSAENLRNIAEDLEAETLKIVNLYVERTGSDESVLRSLMIEDKFVDMNKAKELGFISEIKMPISASEKHTKKWNHSNNNNMAKTGEKVGVNQSLLAKMLAKLGYTKIEDAEAGLNMVAMDLSTADGSTLTVEREEGEPEVGDKANPDGEHLMPDGKTIIVVDGVITEIKQPEGESGNEELEAANARIAELEAEVASLKTQAKSKDDLTILNKVKTMGGLEGLSKIASSYIPKSREFTEKGEKGEKVSAEARLHGQFREELNNKRNNRKK